MGTVLFILGYTLMAIGVLITIVQFRKAFRTKRDKPVEGKRCICGYPAMGLEIPRCPECGRMIGFDKSPEELGVSQEEMRAEAERRRATRGSANIP